ncbi:MAG TPA: DUF1697 domain-containing protein [Puia sp.]|nr:DUF1697 domain-containing protein [Puia sp.]
MTTLIAILRGINVSGHNKIQMTVLKALFEKLKFKNVSTYIQSGNVVFTVDKTADNESISKKIEHEILRVHNMKIPVIIRTLEEMKNTLRTNPFLKNKKIDIEKLHVTFLASDPEKINLEGLKNIDYSPDQFVIIEKEIYLHCPNGYGITKLSNNFFENKLKVGATTRNWKTVNALVRLASGQ